MDFQIYPLCAFDGGKSQRWHLRGWVLRCYAHKTDGLALVSPLPPPRPPQPLLPIFPDKSQPTTTTKKRSCWGGGEVRKRPSVTEHRGSAPEVIRETILGVRNHPRPHLWGVLGVRRARGRGGGGGGLREKHQKSMLYTKNHNHFNSILTPPHLAVMRTSPIETSVL